MMRFLLFAGSLSLAIVGGTSAVLGVVAESYKPIAVGLVLIFTAGVLATLYLGTRPKMP